VGDKTDAECAGNPRLAGTSRATQELIRGFIWEPFELPSKKKTQDCVGAMERGRTPSKNRWGRGRVSFKKRQKKGAGPSWVTIEKRKKKKNFIPPQRGIRTAAD